MNTRSKWRPASVLVMASIVLCGTTPAALAADGRPYTVVPRATCGPGDHPETGLQGQVPANLRASGYTGFNCNLELIGQARGDGANWQTAEFVETKANGHVITAQNRVPLVCGYHGTASPTLSLAGRTNFGSRVLDLTNASAPQITSVLTTVPMLDPWESIKVNQARALLAANDAWNGGHGPLIDFYDLSQDCRFPQLLGSVTVGTGADGGSVAPNGIVGHEGAWAPDGLTYYIGDTTNKSYHAIDVSDPTHPKHIATFDMKSIGLASHGLSISDDGMRGYMASPRVPGQELGNNNGFVILDLSDVQRRVANPQIRVISTFLFNDGTAAQHTIPVTIKGKPYIIQVDELGSGGFQFGGAGPTAWSKACDAGLAPFGMPRIVDISDEENPKLVSTVTLEVNHPENCRMVLPDLTGLSIFTYDSHYCSVDRRKHATTLACGMFNSGIRVFDIRDPAHPREIAYFNPAGTTTPSAGSNHNLGGNWKSNGPDWCSAQLHLDAARGTIWTTCQDNGVIVLKFTNGVWPFPETTTPPGQQN